jgi:hypothetical protein
VNSKVFKFLAVPALAFAVFATACGDEDKKPDPAGIVEEGSGVNDGPAGIVEEGSGVNDGAAGGGGDRHSMSAETIEFEGRLYRLAGFEQRDITADGYEVAGEASSVNAEDGVTGSEVFVRDGDTSAVYTLAGSAVGGGPDADLFMRWELES